MPAPYNPRVIVKFKNDVQIPYENDATVEQHLNTGQIGPWLQLKQQFPDISIGRLFTSVAPQQILQLMHDSAAGNPNYNPPNFLTYLALSCPATTNRIHVAQALRDKTRWPKVQTAYLQSGPGAGPGIVLGPGETDRQGYLGPAPTTVGVPGGIDAKFAWALPGGDGGNATSDLRFADIEQGWVIEDGFNTAHEDLKQDPMTPSGIRLIFGDNTYEFGHGTSVLGIVLAAPNNNSTPASAMAAPRRDIVGIAPHVARKFVASRLNGANDSVADAIMVFLASPNPNNRLRAGDVLLLEVQTGTDSDYFLKDHPVELEDLEFDVIRQATESGIIVVEAAGNWGADLDQVFHPDHGYILKRGHADFRDSRAIMVGAADFDNRGPLQNYGSRIDCYAWGGSVTTTGFDDSKPQPLDPRTTYNQLDGTSSASAIIAGAALAVQGIKKANPPGSPPYSPIQLRNLLSDPTTGTLSQNSDAANPNSDLIGVMPDLKKIIGTAMGLAPDVYLRDALGDAGGTPHVGPIASSPDIILRLAPGVANPQGAFGQGSGQEDNDWLGVNAEPGTDHVVYVRVRNRGTVDTVNVSATVYWSPVATLLTPNLWTLVGTTVIPVVPRSGDLTVSPAIPWPANQVPATPGHHCFVGFVGNGADPAPTLASIATWPSFEHFLRDHNNVTLRNFNVVTYDSARVRDYSEHSLHFFITGPHDQARNMRLEFSAKTHEGTQILLQVPSRYRSLITAPDITGEIEPHHVAQIRLNTREVWRSREQLFPHRLMVDSTLHVRIPNEYLGHPSLLVIRQLYEDREVGRITWRLQPMAT